MDFILKEEFDSVILFFFWFYLHIYFWLHWVFVAMREFSPIVVLGLLITVASLVEHKL